MDEKIGFGLYHSSGDRGSVGHVSVFWLLSDMYHKSRIPCLKLSDLDWSRHHPLLGFSVLFCHP